MVLMARIQRTLVPVILDILVVFLSFLLALWFKPGPVAGYFNNYLFSLCVFLLTWIVSSAILGKYRNLKKGNLKEVLLPVLTSHLAALGTVAILMYLFRSSSYSRFIVFGTILIATVAEIILANLYYYIRRSVVYNQPTEREYRGMGITEAATRLHVLPEEDTDLEEPEVSEYIRNTILEESGEEAFHFLNHHAALNDRKTLILATTSRFNLEPKRPGIYKTIINLRRINDIRRMNKFFETVNHKLPVGGTFIGCVETKDMRKQRIFRKFWTPFNYLFYYFIDFPVKRIFPKFGFTKGLYFLLTRGNNRVITRAETLGRLISCGFEIGEEAFVGPLFYFVARKVNEPRYDMHPSYGPFVRLKRIGRDGKIIRVLKMRTMHPYAEYLQEYMYNKHNLQNGGKFNNDFRVSTQGKIMRKLWIDELPMLYNWFRGDVKLVGVRPLSEQYFSLYRPEVQEKRIRYKPGLIPPFYADLPETLDEIQDSEVRYLEAFDKHPFRTDWKYFWKALFNIVFRRARSK